MVVVCVYSYCVLMTDGVNIINHSVCLPLLRSAKTDPALLIRNSSSFSHQILPRRPARPGKIIAVFQLSISIFGQNLINIKFEVRQDRGRCWGRGNDEPRGETETRESKTGEREGGRQRESRHKILLYLTLN